MRGGRFARGLTAALAAAGVLAVIGPACVPRPPVPPLDTADALPGEELWTEPLAARARAFCTDAPSRYLGHPEDGYRYLCENLRTTEEWFAARFVGGSYAKVAEAIRKIEPARPVRRVFYPFGGPDLATPFSVFPDVEEVVAVALEDPGDPAAPFVDLEGRARLFPYPNDIAEPAEASPLAALFTALAAYHGSGYSTMEHITNAALAPVVLAQAMRDLGAEIDSLKRFALSEDGRLDTIAPEEAAGRADGATVPAGVQLVFTLARPGGPRTCVYRYLRWNLDDSHFQPETPLGRYLERFDFEGVLVKAASNLPTKPSFTNVRRRILDRARVIVDDGEMDPAGEELVRNFTTRLVPIGPLSFGYVAAHDGNQVPIRVRSTGP